MIQYKAKTASTQLIDRYIHVEMYTSYICDPSLRKTGTNGETGDGDSSVSGNEILEFT